MEVDCSRNTNHQRKCKARRNCKVYKISLGQFNEEVEHLRLAPKSHVSRSIDIAARVRKVKSTKESLQYDLPRLEKAFIDLQDSVISNNNVLSKRINVLTKQLKGGNVNEMKALVQSPNAGVELTQQTVPINKDLKRNASLHADENVPSEAKQQSQDSICHASSHLSERREEMDLQA